MTPEIVAALHPPRLPANAARLGPGEAAVAFGIGLLVALVCFRLVQPFLHRRPPPPNVTMLLDRLAALPAAERPLAAARLFERLGAAMPDPLRTTLYAPGTTLDPSTLRPSLAAAWAAATPAARRRADA